MTKHTENAQAVPLLTWKANFLDLLEPIFTPKQIKDARKKRQNFMLKIKLLLELINLLVSDTQSLEEDQLSKHWTQLLKLRNDEY